MPGIPTNFPKPTILVHPPMHFDTRAMWAGRNADYIRVATAFFDILSDATSDKEVKSRPHHRDTWRGDDMIDWLQYTSPYVNSMKIGKSMCSAYEIEDSHFDVAAELFMLKSKRIKKAVIRMNDESIDLAEHSSMWHYNGRYYDNYGSLLNAQQLALLSLLTQKCTPVKGKKTSRHFAAH